MNLPVMSSAKSRRSWRIVLAACLSLGSYAAAARADTSGGSTVNAVLCPAAEHLEAQTIVAAPKCVATTVGIVTRSQEPNNMRMGSGSGVVISADGLVLTAGHVIDKPGTPLTIRFTDGRVVKGVALGVDRQVDTGLARISDPAPEGGWAFSTMAPADSAHTGDWVLTTGNPGSIVIGRNPPLRLGRVTGHEDTAILTNCTMEPGDSGGPVFDLSGRVVGINSKIMLNGGKEDRLLKDQSLHVPISQYAKQWDDLLAGKNNHPEFAAQNGGTAPHGMRQVSRLGEALQKLAERKDAQALKILEDTRKNGGRMNVTPEQAKELIWRAHLSESTTQPADEPNKRPGISGQLRPLISRQIRRSLLKQFPGAKVTDQVLERIMDKSTFDKNGHLDIHPDLDDLAALGVTPDKVAGHGSTLLDNRLARQLGKNSLQSLALLAPALDAAGDCVVEIRTGDKPVLLGTIVDANGLIVTKASDLPDHVTVALADGRTFQPKVLGKDDKTDLALLKIDVRDLTPVRFADAPPVGAWLGSPVYDPNQPVIGIVSDAARPIPEKFAHFAGEQKVILGVAFMGNDRIIKQVTPGMPADAIGMKAGDEVLELNGKPVKDHDEFANTVKQAKTGDELTIKVRRDGKEMEFKPILGQRKTTTETMDGIGEADQFAGGKISKRRSNFPMAIQHDGTVWADQCGGPLINLEGQTVGINIARYDRVCTFAIPAELVQKTVAKLRTN